MPALAVPLLASALAACSREPTGSAFGASVGETSERVELFVYAATSTRDALQALETEYEHDHSVDLVFQFGSSGDLSRQILAAGKADVFLSADEREMDRVEAADLLEGGTRQTLLSNQLVVIEPSDGPTIFTAPFEPSQLELPAVRLLSLGDVETVPAGRYAKAWLQHVEVWDAVADRVLPGIDVRAALAAVESAGAQAGIVYRTDVARSTRARVVFAVPLEDGALEGGPRIAYSVAVLAARPHVDAARAFERHLGSPTARTAFEDVGFVFLPTLPTAR